MANIDILSDAFSAAAAAAGRKAREDALAAGHAVVFRDQQGRYVKEMPDGRLFEIRFHPDRTGDAHAEVIRELERPGV